MLSLYQRDRERKDSPECAFQKQESYETPFTLLKIYYTNNYSMQTLPKGERKLSNTAAVSIQR